MRAVACKKMTSSVKFSYGDAGARTNLYLRIHTHVL